MQRADGIGTQWNIPLSRSTKREEVANEGGGGGRESGGVAKAYRRRDAGVFMRKTEKKGR